MPYRRVVRRHTIHFVHLELRDLALPLHRVVSIQEGVWVRELGAFHGPRSQARVYGKVRII
jgi:hypothetical protein